MRTCEKFSLLVLVLSSVLSTSCSTVQPLAVSEYSKENFKDFQTAKLSLTETKKLVNQPLKFSGESPTTTKSLMRSFMRSTIGDNKFWVNVSVNGVTRPLIIDSGSPITILMPDFAQKAKVVLSNVSGKGDILMIPGKEFKITLGKVKDLSIGSLMTHNAPVFIPSARVNTRLFGMTIIRYHGILGLNTLRNLSVTFTFQDDAVIFSNERYSPTGSENETRFEIRKGTLYPYILGSCSVNGKRFCEYTFDTGASNLVLPKSAWKKLGFSSTEKSKLVTLRIADTTFENVRASYDEQLKNEILVPLSVFADGGFKEVTMDSLAGKLYWK
jgi:predicted aspartyl protease